PVTEVGVFNGRRFFAGTVAGKSVVMGLTGIGLVDADLTTRAVLAFLQSSGVRVKAVVFSGVAGSSYNIGDVVVPDHWTDDLEHSAPPFPPYAVNRCLYRIARRIVGTVALDPNLYVEDGACTGLRTPPSTPVRVDDPQVRINPGDEGHSSDPDGGRHAGIPRRVVRKLGRLRAILSSQKSGSFGTRRRNARRVRRHGVDHESGDGGGDDEANDVPAHGARGRFLGGRGPLYGEVGQRNRARADDVSASREAARPVCPRSTGTA